MMLIITQGSATLADEADPVDMPVKAQRGRERERWGQRERERKNKREREMGAERKRERKKGRTRERASL